MSLQAVCEVSLHFGSFRNVDLFYQGVYQLRCRVYEEGSNGIAEAFAVPHSFTPDGSSLVEDGLPQACVLEGQAMFCTKSVLIRYCQEQIDLNDVALFRIERSVSKEDAPMMVEVQLLYAESPATPAISSYRCAQERIMPSNMPDPPGLRNSDFIVASTQHLRLHEVMTGIHAFCPISFDEMHFCRVELMVHSAVLDYRLRIRPEVPALRGSLLEALVELAGELSAGEPEAARARHSSDASMLSTRSSEMSRVGSDLQSPDAAGTSLCEAMDLLQRKCLERLLLSHVDLTAFLQDIWWTAEGSVLPDKQTVSALPAQLPGHDKPEAAKYQNGIIPISVRLSDPQSASAACRLLVEDMSFVAAQVLQAWQRMLKTSLHAMEAVSASLQTSWNKALVRHWAEAIFCVTCPVGALSEPLSKETVASNSRAALDLRKSAAFQDLRSHVVEDLESVPPGKERPVAFEQRFTRSQDALERNPSYVRGELLTQKKGGPEKGAHLVILVHGFQGTSFDMRLIKNNVMLMYPQAICLCSVANEEDTEGNIETMGERLAAEVRAFVEEWCPSENPDSCLGRLSFLTHSVGGLIARAALPLLAEFHKKMFTFMSFSSAHLGYVYWPNNIFKAGLWVVKRLKKSRCLEQLSMTDSPDKGSCFLTRLSELPGLEFFQHVVLVSSRQDQYAPFESARIEMPAEAEADPGIGAHYIKMLRNILDPVEAERVIRIDVDFHIQETNIDSVIGRTAHIQFIENQAFMKMLVQTHGYLFE